MSVQRGQVVEWIDAAELAGVDQTHEEITDPSPVPGLVKQRVFAVEDGLLKRYDMIHSFRKSFIEKDLTDSNRRLAGGWQML